MATTSKISDYDESSLKVLKGLEPVRLRPDMYTRTENPLHIIQEVIDNAADEALGGFASNISVEVNSDGSVTVSDNGRGIPIGLHAEEHVPVVTLAFTRLHAGGKFEKGTGGAYAFSGGLHGVGVAVTTALSKSVIVEVKRNSKVYRVEYLDNGRQIGDVVEVGTCSASDTGTKVTALPDEAYFGSPKLPLAELERLLKSKAIFLPGVKVTLVIDGKERSWQYESGIQQYFEEVTSSLELVAPMYISKNYVKHEIDADGTSSKSALSDFSDGEGASYALAWSVSGAASSESYVNLIPTKLGGTHEAGLKAGIYEALKSFIDHHNLLPKNVKIQQDDAVCRMSFVLSAMVLDPQFQGQVKDKLNSRNVPKLISLLAKDPFEAWLNENIEYGKLIAEIAIKNAVARQKNGQAVEKKKSSAVGVLPGKLAECEQRYDNELFLVEGDSAGGSAKMARNKDTQAILPLRGKVLNTFEIDADKLFANNEIMDISLATGVDPHTFDTDPVVALQNARYDKIIIMTDADVDGSHIRTLLLTLFYRHMPHLLTQGRVFVALPPLFRIDIAQYGKSKPRRIYALDEQEKVAVFQKIMREGIKEEKIEVSRFKGLGEMNDEQLKETSMDPATRRVLPVVYDREKALEINNAFKLCMSKSEADGRKNWMSEESYTVLADS